MSPTKSPRTKRVAKGAAAPAPAPPRPFVAHHLVPPHELLSEAETQSVLAELKSHVERLPKILVTDPGLRTDPNFQKARDTGENLAGRLVRVRRPSATAGEAVAYRAIIQHLGE